MEIWWGPEWSSAGDWDQSAKACSVHRCLCKVLIMTWQLDVSDWVQNWLCQQQTQQKQTTWWESGEGLSSPVSLSSVNLCHQDGKRAGHSPNQSVCLSIYWILTSSRHFIFFICSVSEGVATWLQRAALSSELPAVLMVFWPKKAPCWAWSWFLLVSAEGTILQPWGRCF